MQYMKSGFTLIELLIAIAIIGVLAIIMLPNLISSQKRSYDTGAIMCAKSLQTAQAISFVDDKTYLNFSGEPAAVLELKGNLDQSCRNQNIYFKDRSSTNSLSYTYTFDIWDKRGSATITVTPTNVTTNSIGATPFSSTGVGGTNFP
ncbi:prepilin-type N-terminal cleavage/methylation domain-containing protein [Deinococcus arcticus]|uniref:Type II secretion system protein n=1 Tax=Deinococcus arcticus TaxID=2136176 RepID=A0A2T3W3W2_9DEIO|nr:prepilin-type N-terminal cleavage/methylation domain-containing protein [Deinococcus arcticus]PTA66567.1 type II secretion system protein [Deinococcus arcticus]